MLAVVMLYTQAALSDSSLPDRLHAQLEAVISEVDRAGGLIRQILDFGRQTQMELQHLDLLPFLKEQAVLLARLLPESIEVGFKYDRGDYLILGYPTRLAQVLLNLALNARDAMPNGGQLGLELGSLVWVMPIMGGQALLSELKGRGISLPFVVLTGHPMDPLTEVTALDGVVDKLQKLPDLLTLAETVGRILRTGNNPRSPCDAVSPSLVWCLSSPQSQFDPWSVAVYSWRCTLVDVRKGL
ncbi:MAG TPA: hypothetical protein ENL34_10285 [Chloroflexi bacterium]|nr:hypothetical protein [Chloroflexota bacterium]